MKSIFIFLALLIASSQAISQCDKKVMWYASKGEMLDASGKVLDTKVDSIFFETEPQKITLRFKWEDKALEGTVKDKSCDWIEPFSNGKTVYHADVFFDDISSNAVFTLEAKEGKITLLLEIQAREGRKFLIYIDNYEEAK
jgi:hypothetical protein